MPTYREDIHLGHDVALVDTDDIVNGAITEEKMADGSVSERALQDGSVTEPKLADNAVSTRTIQDGAVTEPKLADDSVSHRTIQPDAVHGDNIKPGEIETKHLDDACVTTSKIQDKAVTPEKLSDGVQGAIVSPITESLDQKYKNITDELYSMIASLQVGGIALSQQFGDRTDIGISQKTLTKALGRFWQEMETITGKDYMNFSLSVVPSVVFSEAPATITIKADCSDAISNFDSIKVYVDNVLIGESSDIEVYTKAHTISETSQVKAVGVILGKTVTKTVTAIKEIPFFMGSGQRYEDVMDMECHKELHGSLEGDYVVVVRNTNDYIFIIIPISHKEEFRRAKLDMNGFEIPLEVMETPDYIICQTLNRYQAGTYNIDIDINS